ncbi:MAG: alpha/beta hydrolase [Elusimicrobiales bacterium]|nr:alpha/beta hydrolase [Elusimicrobiales bacterium]
MIKTIHILLFLLAVNAGQANAAQTLNSFDGYGLDYTIDYPADKDASKVIVLLHGSGQHDMNEDLSEASAPGTKNLFFADVSGALTQKGFAVIRYNKRSYQWKKTLGEDPAFIKSPVSLEFIKNPLKYFVEDAAAFAKFAAKTFPKARIYLLGHSEGTQVALQVAEKMSEIRGVALVGFAAQSLDISMFEQTVYRPLNLFDALDLDRNSFLTQEELKKDDPVAKSLTAQLPVLDLNKNGSLDRSEFMAGNFTNILLDAPSLREYRKQEAMYKKPAAIIKDAKFDIAFFQGELDNQTPAYNAKAIQIMNNLVWKKPNLHFRFYDGLGHALDKRTDLQDIVYRQADQQALSDMASDLASYWK